MGTTLGGLDGEMLTSEEMNRRFVASAYAPLPDMLVEDGAFYLYKSTKDKEYEIQPELLFTDGEYSVFKGFVGNLASSQSDATMNAIRIFRGDRLVADMVALPTPEVSHRDVNLIATIRHYGVFAFILSVDTYYEGGCEQDFWCIDFSTDSVPAYLGRLTTEGDINLVEVGDVSLTRSNDLYVENFYMHFPPVERVKSALVGLHLYRPNDTFIVREGIDPGYLRNQVDPELAESSVIVDDSAIYTEEYKMNILKSYVGTWYLDGDPELASIEIFEDGTFVSYYATGNEEFHGYIEVISGWPKFAVWREGEGGKCEFIYHLVDQPYRGSLRSPIYDMDFEPK